MSYIYEISMIMSTREYMSYKVITEINNHGDGQVFRHKVDEIVDIIRDLEQLSVKSSSKKIKPKVFESDYMNSLIRTHEWITDNYPELLL